MSSKPQIRRSARLALLCALFTAWASPSFAEPGDAPAPDALRIESSTCSHPLLEDVQRLLHVELKSAELAGGESAPRLFLSCSERVSLIRAVINGHEGTRQLDLAGTDPTLHARVIALAAAELLRDTAHGEAVEPAPAPPPKPPLAAPAPEPEPSIVAPVHASSRLVAFVKLENFGSSFHPLSGGGLDFSHELGHFSLGLGPTLATGDRKLDLGSVRVVAADLSLHLAYRFPNRALPGEVGIGHALGLARLTGSSASASTNSASLGGLWLGPFVFGTLDVSLTEPLFLQIAAQFGVVTLPIHGQVEHDSDVEIAGLWSSVSLGLALNL